jgi:hypothetical protein
MCKQQEARALGRRRRRKSFKKRGRDKDGPDERNSTHTIERYLDVASEF